MPYSQNGWLGLRTAQQQAEYLTTITIPGTDPVRRFRVRKGDVARCFEWLIGRFHREVESLNEGHPNDDWSFAYRSVRAGASLSNHASGTAVDLNATQHPLGTSPTANFTAGQRSAIRRILNDADGVFRWGGNYSGRKDPMHFEINTGAAGVDALARKIAASTTEGDDDMGEFRVYTIKPVTVAAGARDTLVVVDPEGRETYALGADMKFDITVELETTGAGWLFVYQWDADAQVIYHDYKPVRIDPIDGLTHARNGIVTHGRHLRLAVQAGDLPVVVSGGRVDMHFS